jgi:hypothetical protein
MNATRDDWSITVVAMSHAIAFGRDREAEIETIDRGYVQQGIRGSSREY